jgi:tRNA(Ile)-lysidine synthase
VLNLNLEFLKGLKTIFVACSGGMDSIALCHLLKRNQIQFSIAHCNFGLRGIESDGDESFVEAYAKEFKIPFYTERYNTLELAKQNKTSIEEEARNLRYNFFGRLSEEYKIEAFLTAHHLDDQVETILMRIIAGTGIQGLQGIPTFREPNYYRPLLHISRKEIQSYVSEYNIMYREDSSNSDLIYKRNMIRQEILPKIELLNPSYREAFVHIKQISNEVNELLLDSFSDMRATFQTTRKVNLKGFVGKKYLPILLQFIFAQHCPNKTELQQMSLRLNTPELKKFQCGDIWVEIRGGHISEIVES